VRKSTDSFSLCASLPVSLTEALNQRTPKKAPPPVSVRLPASKIERLNRAAACLGIPRSWLIVAAIDLALEQLEAEDSQSQRS